MTDLEQARVRWIEERPQYEAFGCLVKDQIGTLLKPLGIWFEVSARAKEVDSLIKKLIKKRNHTFESLPDKVGARVVIKYRQDLERVVTVIKSGFDSSPPDDKTKDLGTKSVGYQSIHIDGVRFRQGSADAGTFPPGIFWVEVQVRTLAQHLWSEMSHDSVYKNDEMIAALGVDVVRRVHLMAGQIEVADREFDRLNSELSEGFSTFHLLKVLETHYFRLTARRPDIELTLQVLQVFVPVLKSNVDAFATRLDSFLSSKHAVLESVYSQAAELGAENTTPLLFQPEALLIYDLLLSDPLNTRRVWNQNYPEPELERIANAFGISFD